MKALAQKTSILAAMSALFTVSAGAEDRPIVLGVPVELSGANSVVAPSVMKATEPTVSEINAAGGLLTRKVVVEVAKLCRSATPPSFGSL